MTDATPLTLGFSPCPNDTFVFHALVHGLVPGGPSVSVTYADIDVLNTLAGERSLDVVKVSVAAMPWLRHDYALLPVGGAVGRGCGPLLLTHPDNPRTAMVGASARPDDLAGATVAVPGLRTTAYLLFRLWAAAGGPTDVTVLPFDEIMPAVRAGQVDAGLVIHESRFTYPDYGLQAVVDLGEWWERDTGLPIPLGAILARRDLGATVLRDLTEGIRSSVTFAWSHPEASRPYVLSHSQELAPDVVDAHIALYVNEFTRELGVAGHHAITELLTRAAVSGLTPPLTGALD